MDVSLLIRHRLKELGLEQRDLAAAAQVTESYISQLLAGKKAPPSPGRTDIYGRIGKVLGVPVEELSRLADLQRKEDLKRKAADPPQALFKAFREAILRKCEPGKARQIRLIFERENFGALERLVTQKLLDVAKRVAREELESENWLRVLARLRKQSYEQTRVMILEFLDADVFEVSVESCVRFLDPLIESWDIDLDTFGMEIVLNRRLTRRRLKKFEFVEREAERPIELEPGLQEFLNDASLSAGATPEEIEFLKTLRFKERKPLPLFYYRVLQSLRDPVHFRLPDRPRVRSRVNGSA